MCEWWTVLICHRLKRSCWLRHWQREKQWRSMTSWSFPIASLRYAPAISLPVHLHLCLFDFLSLLTGHSLRLKYYATASIALMKICHITMRSFSSHQAITARDSMAKSLYSALFDWIVLRINHALLNKKDMEESVPVRHKKLVSFNNVNIFGRNERTSLHTLPFCSSLMSSLCSVF